VISATLNSKDIADKFDKRLDNLKNVELVYLDLTKRRINGNQKKNDHADNNPDVVIIDASIDFGH
jgi:hypothetical protein